MFLIVRTKDQIRKTSRYFTESDIAHKTFAISSTQLNRIDISKEQQLDGFIVTSPNAVLAIPQTKLPFFCVGDATEKECIETGRRVAFTGRSNAENMAADMAKRFPPMRVIHAAGDRADTSWYQTLTAKGIEVVNKLAYQTVYSEKLDDETIALLKSEPFKAIVFFSSQGAEHFQKLMVQAGLQSQNFNVITFSQQIAQHCQNFKNVLVCEEPSLKAVKNVIQTL